jgi:hypothetical protein
LGLRSGYGALWMNVHTTNAAAKGLARSLSVT